MYNVKFIDYVYLWATWNKKTKPSFLAYAILLMLCIFLFCSVKLNYCNKQLCNPDIPSRGDWDMCGQHQHTARDRYTICGQSRDTTGPWKLIQSPPVLHSTFFVAILFWFHTWDRHIWFYYSGYWQVVPIWCYCYRLETNCISGNLIFSYYILILYSIYTAKIHLDDSQYTSVNRHYLINISNVYSVCACEWIIDLWKLHILIEQYIQTILIINVE